MGSGGKSFFYNIKFEVFVSGEMLIEKCGLFEDDINVLWIINVYFFIMYYFICYMLYIGYIV